MSFPRYPKYKDSGIPWLGEMPEHWAIKRVRHLTEIKKRIAGTLGYDVLSITQRGIVPKDIESGEGQLSMDYTKYQIVNPGDFAMNHMDLLTGYVDISIYSGVTSPDYRVFIYTGEGAKRYYLYLFQMGYHEKILFHYGQGSAQLGRWRLPTDAFKELPFPVPTKLEQSAIVAFLDLETARIDALVEKKTRFIELLKEKRSALITDAVTGKLDVTTGKPYPKYKPSGVEWLGEVPEGWGMKRLRHVALFTNSNVDKKSYEGQQSVRLCNYKDVYYNEFIIRSLPFMDATASDAEVEKFALKKGDVLITKDSEDPSDIGIPALVEEDLPNVICGYHLTVLRVFEPSAARFVHRSIQSHPTKAHFFVESPGITRYGLSQDAIGNIQICLPHENEREAIATFLDRKTARIDALVGKTRRSIDLLKERRSALITAAVTGKIDVRNHADMKGG